MRRLKKKIIFVQSIEMFKTECLITVGYTKKEVIAWTKDKKNRVGDQYKKWIASDEVTLDETLGHALGCLFFNSTKEHSNFLLSTREFCDAWEFWEVLLHEIVHLVQQIKRDRGIKNEDEAEAYLTEFLFHSIRRKLQGVEKI